jgi:hypothetical protein
LFEFLSQFGGAQRLVRLRKQNALRPVGTCPIGQLRGCRADQTSWTKEFCDVRNPLPDVERISNAYSDIAEAIGSSAVGVESSASEANGFLWIPGLVVTAEERLADELKINVFMAGGSTYPDGPTAGAYQGTCGWRGTARESIISSAF